MNPQFFFAFFLLPPPPLFRICLSFPIFLVPIAAALFSCAQCARVYLFLRHSYVRIRLLVQHFVCGARFPLCLLASHTPSRLPLFPTAFSFPTRHCGFSRQICRSGIRANTFYHNSVPRSCLFEKSGCHSFVTRHRITSKVCDRRDLPEI